MSLRACRRDRAARQGPELFLLERAFDDCLERLSLVQRRFDRAVLLGCPDPGWTSRLSAYADRIEVVDPGLAFARSGDGRQIVEDQWQPDAESYDLAVAIGTLDTVNDLPRALITLRWAMRGDAMLVGAMSGGDTLPRLRLAMRAADAVTGTAAPHVHPRVEPAALANLLAQAGFANPVVDVDRVNVAYPALDRLVADLRKMAATSVLNARSRPLSRDAARAAQAAFAAQAANGRTTETFEILHFAGWNRALEDS